MDDRRRIVLGKIKEQNELDNDYIVDPVKDIDSKVDVDDVVEAKDYLDNLILMQDIYAVKVKNKT